MFLELRNNKTYHDDDMPDIICQELIRIDRIVHVYIEAGSEQAIVIEYINRKGGNSEVIESFNDEIACHERFREISKILTREEKQNESI